MEVIILKKRVALITFVLGLIIVLFSSSTTAFSLTHINKKDIDLYAQNESLIDSKEDVYKDIFVTLLAPYIDKAIENHYGKPYAFAPWDVYVLSITRPDGDFIIKLQISPYIGAHNSVGVDNIIIKVSYGEAPIVQKFEHIRSYEIPPWLKW